MSKVQAAIAKARAAREDAQRRPGEISPRSHHPSSDQQSIILTRNLPAPPMDRAMFWVPLETFTPSDRRMARHRIVSFNDSGQKAPGAVALDMLRTKVLQQMRAHNWKRLAITSPGADCGKTTVALNLAFSLSRQADRFTIVAEMDMRRPSMAKTFGLTGQAGFSAVIDGSADFADVAMRPRPNLAFGVNYAPARNPSELLQSTKAKHVLAQIDERYQPDITIFDMPPMLSSDDTMAFIGQVDCVLLIAAAEATSVKEIDQCERELATQTNVLGVMLNKCRYMDQEATY